MNKKRVDFYKIIITFILLILVILGGTYAWFTYKSKATSLVLSIDDVNNSKVIIKPYEIRGTMTPVNVYSSGVYSQIKAVNSSDETLSIVLFYKINSLDSVLINNGLKYTIASSTSVNGSYSVVSTGDFTSLTTEDELTIMKSTIDANTTIYYRIYFWVDSNVADQSAIQNLIADVELNGRIWIIDKIAPTCSLSASGTTITATYSDNSGVVSYYGWNSSYSGTNSNTKTISATGTYTYYVMDGNSNKGSCSGTVTATTKEKYCSCGVSHAGACYKITGPTSMQYCGPYSYRYLCDTDNGYSKLNDSYCWKAG